jgi:hypothetical protein
MRCFLSLAVGTCLPDGRIHLMDAPLKAFPLHQGDQSWLSTTACTVQIRSPTILICMPHIGRQLQHVQPGLDRRSGSG